MNDANDLTSLKYSANLWRNIQNLIIVECKIIVFYYSKNFESIQHGKQVHLMYLLFLLKFVMICPTVMLKLG